MRDDIYRACVELEGRRTPARGGFYFVLFQKISPPPTAINPRNFPEMYWALWYATTIAAAFVWIAGGVAGSRLSLGECISGAIAVGTIGGAWAIYFAACVTGSLTPLSIFGGTALMVIAAAMRGRRAAREISHMLSTGSLWVALSGASSGSARGTSDVGGRGQRARGGGASAEISVVSVFEPLLAVARVLPLRYPDFVLIALEIFLGLWLWPLYSSRMIPDVNGYLYSGGSCYGDLPIHMQIAK